MTAIGSFASDIVIKALKAMGYRVVGCDIYNRRWIAQSENTDVFYQVPYTSDRGEYIHFMMGVCQREKVDLLLPLTDIELSLIHIWLCWREPTEWKAPCLETEKEQAILTF